MLLLVRKTNFQSYRFLTTTPKLCCECQLLDTFWKWSDVPYGKHPAFLHHDLTQKLGPVYKLDLFGFKQLMLSDPKDFEAVFRTEIPNEDFPNAQFPKVPILSELYGTYKNMPKSKDIYPINKGVIGIDGAEWWKARYLLKTIFILKLEAPRAMVFIHPLMWVGTALPTWHL